MQPTIKDMLLSEFYTRAEVKLPGYHEISTSQFEALADKIESAVKNQIMRAFSDGLNYYNKTFKQPNNE